MGLQQLTPGDVASLKTLAITYITPEQAAKLLQVKKNTIYKWVRSGRLAGVKIGRSVRILENDITARRSGTPADLRKLLEALWRWYESQPEGTLPFGLVNGFFFQAHTALQSHEFPVQKQRSIVE